MCMSCCAEHLRRQIEALLSKHEVDLVLSGHVHSYARTCNVLAGSCVDMRDGGWGPPDIAPVGTVRWTCALTSSKFLVPHSCASACSHVEMPQAAR
jgi:hypothetical protein